MGWLTKEQMKNDGIVQAGEDVLISDKCSIYGKIFIGNHVRVDDFCILTGTITLRNYIHIGAYCGLYGKKGIYMDDFSGLSPRCTLFSASDDFSGDYLISPMSPEIYTNVQGGYITIKQFAQVGANTVIMPEVILGKGSAVGAMSFVNKDVPDWQIWAGSPAKFIKDRKQGLKLMAERIIQNDTNHH